MYYNDTGMLKIPSARYEAKKWINEVTKSRLFNEASLESKKFQCYQISKHEFKLYNPSNILENQWNLLTVTANEIDSILFCR